MGKKPNATSYFYRNNTVVHRLNRKHWNKAVDVIEAYSKKNHQPNLCSRTGPSSRRNARLNNTHTTVPFFLIELRQAILRHDWNAVHCLYDCLLDSYQHYRVLCHKIMMTLLLSSPSSDMETFKDFCRMSLGLDEKETTIFLKTVCCLPKEIPRGYICPVREKLFVKTEVGRSVANAYWKDSQDHREEKIE